MSDPNNSTDPTPGDDNPMSDRGWYAENSWIITPLIVFVFIGLACVALHTYRTRRMRRRAALVHADAPPSSVTWPGRRRRTSAERDPELGFTPASGTLIARIGGGRNDSSSDDNLRTNRNNNNNSVSSPQTAHTAGTTGRRWQNPWTRWGGATNRAPDEGLDEFGEAPPPYETKKQHNDGRAAAVGGGVGRGVVELARLRAEAEAMAGERPPEYGEVVSSGAVQDGEVSREGDEAARPDVTRPERTQER